ILPPVLKLTLMSLGAVTLPLVVTAVITVPTATVAVRVAVVLAADALGGPTVAKARAPPPMATAASPMFAAVNFVTRRGVRPGRGQSAPIAQQPNLYICWERASNSLRTGVYSRLTRVVR